MLEPSCLTRGRKSSFRLLRITKHQLFVRRSVDYLGQCRDLRAASALQAASIKKRPETNEDS